MQVQHYWVYRISGIIRGRKASRITFFTIVYEKTFTIQAILYIKILAKIKKCKKTFTNASRFTKFTNFFFRGWFPVYGIRFYPNIAAKLCYELFVSLQHYHYAVVVELLLKLLDRHYHELLQTVCLNFFTLQSLHCAKEKYIANRFPTKLYLISCLHRISVLKLLRVVRITYTYVLC